MSTEPRQDHPSQESKNRTGLPDKLKGGIEAISGLSLDDVRVHYHSSEPSRLHALAYTRGSEIHVAPGQESQLPHEAWHVVQQSLEKFLSTGIPYTYGRVGSQNIG